MIDTRFYEAFGPQPLERLCALADAHLRTPDAAERPISDLDGLDTATPGSIAFYEDQRYAAQLAQTKAGAVIVREADVEHAQASGAAVVVAQRPSVAFSVMASALFAPRDMAEGDPLIHPTLEREPGVVIAPGVVIGADVRLGEGVRIQPGAVIGPGVTIAEHAVIGAGAVLRFAEIGARSRIHANAVLGEAGFGLAADTGGFRDRPHVGRVRIGEDVTIGACTTIDRGMFADTSVGDGTKIDNLVQIAHNVRIGRNCVIAGCCGLSGSVVLHDRVTLGGSVGIADHCVIGEGASLAGATLVMRDVPPGEIWAGMPAKPMRTFFREVAALNRLARNPRARKGGGDG